MSYDIRHGNKRHYVIAGNQYAACMEVLQREANSNNIQVGPFHVVPFYGEEQVIPMELILRLKLTANNPEGEACLI